MIKTYQLIYFTVLLWTFVCTYHAKGELLKHTIIKGVVKRISYKKIWIKDQLGQIHKVPKTYFAKGRKFNIGKKINYLQKINPKNFNHTFQVRNRKKLTKNEKISLVKSYQIFILTLDSNLKLDKTYTGSTALPKEENNYRILKKFSSLFIKPAIATSPPPEQYSCFYAGWPATGRRRCRAPWNSENYTRCGSSSRYRRCNPTIFGPGEASPERNINSVRMMTDTPNPEKGMCIRVRRTSNMTRDCLEASKNNLDKIVANINTDDFKNFEKSIREFCGMGGSFGTFYDNPTRKRNNSACNRLGERLADIGFALAKSKKCSITNYTAPATPTSGSTTPSAPNACHSIQVRCTQGGKSWTGYVGQEDINENSGITERANGASGTNPVQLSRSFSKDLKLYRLACGGESTDIVTRGEGCQHFTRAHNASNPNQMATRVSVLNSNFSSNDCKDQNNQPISVGQACMVRAFCPRTTGGSTSLVPITAVCKCDILTQPISADTLTGQTVSDCISDTSFSTISQIQNEEEYRRSIPGEGATEQ